MSAAVYCCVTISSSILWKISTRTSEWWKTCLKKSVDVVTTFFPKTDSTWRLIRSWLKVNSRRSKQANKHPHFLSLLMLENLRTRKQNAFKQPEVAAKKKQRHFPPCLSLYAPRRCSFSRVDEEDFPKSRKNDRRFNFRTLSALSINKICRKHFFRISPSTSTLRY